MRKKFTLLLASLFLFGLDAMNAEVTKYYKPDVRKATLASGDVVMFYNTTYDGNQDRTGFLIDGGSSLLLSKQKPQAAPLYSAKEGVWTVETAEDNSTYYKVNLKGINGYVGIGGVTNNTEVRDLFIHKWLEVSEGKESKKSEKADGTIIENNEITADDNLWLIANAATGISNTWNGNEASFATWSTGHAYAIYSVVEAETAELEAYLTTVKTAAVSELETLGKLSIANVASIINEINSVALSNNDLETALNSVETLVVKAKKTINGKSVVFDNSHTDDRAGLSITANASKNKAYGTASEGDETIWTIMSQEDGSFKLYNFVTNKYLSTPGSNDNSANLVDEASAASYNFIVTDANKAALVSGGQMLHQRNVWSPNYDLINWYDLNDPASIWALTEKEIKISREQYDLAAVAKLALPWGIQQAYGLVTDAANYISNYKSDAEGSYEALLDNISDSFFHSAYGDEPGDGSGVHYIQADLGTGVDEFYFYMAPRNEKNRPKDITVSGSNSLDGEFVEIAKVTTTLASSDSYLSTKLGTDGTSYRYIRLTVTSTNTNTTFFTLSELYFLPATADVNSLVDSYNAFATSSITQTAIVDAATALVNAESVLALANIKKEIAALLDANKGNNAATPALGQYTTEAYNALNTAYTAVGATQESLEVAVAAFKASKNRPVFMISNGNVKDYAKDKSIYDNNDGTLNFKATDLWDKTMWWALDMTETEVKVTDEVGIYNVGTGNGFWGASSIKITETNENSNAGIPDDGLFLFYTTGNNTPIHFQDQNQEIVRYASYEATSGSAAMFTYIGNSYDLNKLTDENEFTITEGENYTYAIQHPVKKLNYTRTFSNCNWQSLYVPFNIPVSKLTESFDVARIQSIEGGEELSNVVMNIEKITEGELTANTAYFIRAKKEQDILNLELTNTIIYPAVVNSTEYTIDNNFKFVITGTYDQISLDAGQYALSGGQWMAPASANVKLNPFRVFCTVTKDGEPLTPEAAAAMAIRISTRGESDEETTNIESISKNQDPDVIYDLLGRRVLNTSKGGIYIINNKKVVIK